MMKKDDVMYFRLFSFASQRQSQRNNKTIFLQHALVICDLPATKQLYERSYPLLTVCPSARHTFFTMFLSSYYHDF